MFHLQKLGPNQEAWLHDLETTEAPQAKGRLFDGVGYCCLGRACVVLEPLVPFVRCTLSDEYTFGVGGTVYASAPSEIVNKLCLRGVLGYPRDSESEYLTDMNDGGKYTFKDIARVIRSDPSVYFTEPA